MLVGVAGPAHAHEIKRFNLIEILLKLILTADIEPEYSTVHTYICWVDTG